MIRKCYGSSEMVFEVRNEWEIKKHWDIVGTHQSSVLIGGINKKQRITVSTGLESKQVVPCPTQPVREPNNHEKK